MLTAQGSPLVAGASAPAGTRSMTWIRVLRPFFYGGSVIDRGTERQIDSIFAAELVTGGKAERITTPAVPASSQPPAPAKGKKDSNA